MEWIQSCLWIQYRPEGGGLLFYKEKKDRGPGFGCVLGGNTRGSEALAKWFIVAIVALGSRKIDHIAEMGIGILMRTIATLLQV